MLLKNLSKFFILLFITVSCSSSDDTDISGEENCSLTPDLFIQDVDDITDSSAVFSGNIISPSCESTVTSQGFVYATTTLPKTDDFVIEVAGEDISTSVTGLSPNTKYYVRSFFENPTGEYYSDQVMFTTSIGDINIETKEASNITFDSATSGGAISDDGGSEIISKGVCWSTNPDPTLNDNFVESGTGVGDFNSDITGLEDETVYYARAYITNESGVIYGGQITFETPFEEIVFQGYACLENQQDVDDFGANGYTLIDGPLAIGCNDDPLSSDINNLDALSSINTVGSLDILANPLLDDINGLSNLSKVNGSVRIRENNLLTKLDVFSNITEIGGSLTINYNDNLTNFCGVTTLVSNGVSSYNVYGNAFNPTEQDIIDGNCSN
jgi:hypothetical protein